MIRAKEFELGKHYGWHHIGDEPQWLPINSKPQQNVYTNWEAFIDDPQDEELVMAPEARSRLFRRRGRPSEPKDNSSQLKPLVIAPNSNISLTPVTSNQH